MAAAESGRKVTVAGGGVAALEGVLALRSLLPDAAIEMLAPREATDFRPLAVLAPYALGETPELDLARFASDQGASLRHDTLVEVDPRSRSLRTGRGETIDYDALLVAAGARAVEAVPGALTFRGPQDTRQMGLLFEEYAGGELRRLAFVVPSEVGWTLPAYELALLAAATLKAREVPNVELTLVTAEPAPLSSFGPAVSQAVAEMLAEAGIGIRAGARPRRLADGQLITDGEPVDADRAVALPHLLGPRFAGLPHDDEGFIPIDASCAVEGTESVYAAGDATNYPIKQGGLAAQQADAAADGIAASLGADVQPQPFTPVLRGLLLTGLSPRYLEADLAARDRAPAPRPALWRPSSKVFGRHLLRYLGAEEVIERSGPGEERGAPARELELDLPRTA